MKNRYNVKLNNKNTSDLKTFNLLKKIFLINILSIVYILASNDIYAQPGCGNTNLGTLYPSCQASNATYSAGTIPYWSFNATAGYTYHFSLSSNIEDSYLRIYNSTYVQQTQNDDNGPFWSGAPASLSWTCTTSGTYYISAAHYSCTAMTNAGNMAYWSNNAAYINSGGTLTPTSAWQNQSYSAGNVFWYKFNASACNVYDFSLCSNSEDSYLRIYDEHWNFQTYNDDNGVHCTGAPASLSWTCPTTGTYIVQISHYSCVAFSNSSSLAYKYTAGSPPSTPTSVVATPSTVCFGQSVNLNAISAGNTIRWWTASSGGTMIGTSASGANFTVYPNSTTTYYAEAYNSCASSRIAVTVTVGSPGTVSTTTMPASVTLSTTPSTPGAALGMAGGLTYTYTSSSWPTCVNWGLPTTVAAVNLYNAGPTCSFNNLTFDAANAETNLTLGKACFTGTYNYYCVNTGGSYHLNDCRVRMRVVVTKSDGTTPLPFVLIGTNIMLQAKENFIVKVYIEGYAWIDLSGCIWSGTDYYNTSVNGGWPGVVDIFNSLHTDPTSLICTQFSPLWYTINSSATATSNSPVCVGNTLNLTSSSTLGSCYANWSGPNGFSSTLPNPSITGVTTAAAGTYNLIISDGKVCYGTAATTPVTVNTNSTDPTSINAVIN